MWFLLLYRHIEDSSYISHTSSLFLVFCTTAPLYRWEFTHELYVSFPSPFLFFLALFPCCSKTKWETS